MISKPADSKLPQDEEELKRIIDLISDHIVVLDAGGTAIFVNQQVLEYTGLSDDEVRAGNFRERAFHPEDVDRLREERNKALAGTIPFQNEQRVLRRDGKYRWFQVRYNPLLDDSGRAVRWYCTGTDIEDRKRAEDELRRSERDLHEAQSLSHTGSWKYDLLTGAIVLTPEMARIFAEPSTYDGAWSTEYFFSRFHPEDRERVKGLFEVSVEQKTDFQAEYLIVLPDGRIRHLHTVGHPVAKYSGELAEFFGTTVDVTENWEARAELERALEEIKEAHEQLRRDELELRRIVDVIPQMLRCTTPMEH